MPFIVVEAAKSFAASFIDDFSVTCISLITSITPLGTHDNLVASILTSGELTYYENKFVGIQFDVNDALSVSFNSDESEKNVRAAVAVGATAGTKSTTTMEQDSIQIAYTTGGATIGITQVEVDNADYTAGKNETQSVISLGISF